jgi:hypothetical protein
MLPALPSGEHDPTALTALAEPELRATPEELMDGLQAAETMSPLHRQILRLFLERLTLIEEQMATLQGSIAGALQEHEQAVVPGFGVDPAEQVIAEVGRKPLPLTLPTNWLPG